MSIDRRQWSNELPKLHELLGQYDAERESWLEQVRKASLQHEAAKGGDTDWHRLRRDYFETIAIADKRRLGRPMPSDELVRIEYRRLVDAKEATELPPKLRKFLDVNIDEYTGDVKPVIYGSGQQEIVICAWASKEFLECHDPTPQWPLPPLDIGRDYHLPEIAFALAVLHDADGSFEPWIPEGHELHSPLFLNYVTLVRAAGLESTASDEWTDRLAKLFRRAKKELGGPALGDGRLSPAIDLPQVNLETNQVRYVGQCHDVTADGALLFSKLVENYPQAFSASKLFSKPSRVRDGLPDALKALIVAQTGKGYRLILG